MLNGRKTEYDDDDDEIIFMKHLYVKSRERSRV